MASTGGSRFAQLSRERQGKPIERSDDLIVPLDDSQSVAEVEEESEETMIASKSEVAEEVISETVKVATAEAKSQVAVDTPIHDVSSESTRASPRDRMKDKMKLHWNDSWIFEQERRSNFERKLQSNEAWWPAALQVMRGASEQNMLLMSIVDQQIKLEHNSANSLGDIAVAASGIASSSPSKDSREQEIARIAATAASNHSASDLAPGRILNQLGAEMGVEALRRLRTAAECRKVLIDNRLSPMACDFTESLTVEAGKGVGLLKIGRDIDLYVRDMFGAYDAAARHAQREGQEAVEVGADVWLLNLRWRLACVWQGSLWKETTRRFRGQFEALHKIEHNRRIIWANSFDVWQKTVAKSFGSDAHKLPFTQELARTLKGASSSSALTHSEMMSAVKRKVPASLADVLTEKEDVHSHKLHYSPVVGNPLVLGCEFFEHRCTYGAGLMSSWETCCAVLTASANLMLFPVSKDIVSRAARRHAAHTQSAHEPTPCHVVLAEYLATLDPAGPPLPAGHTRAAEVAANARAEAARTGPMPSMPPKLSPGTGVVVRNCVINLSTVSRTERMFELSESQEATGLFGFFPATSTRVTTLRTADQNILKHWVNLLRKYSKPE